MYKQVGSCPKCGAPIYVPVQPAPGLLPEPSYTCLCRFTQVFAPARECQHCYCLYEGGSSDSVPHYRCCKCGDRRGAGYTISCEHPMTNSVTWPTLAGRVTVDVRGETGGNSLTTYNHKTWSAS